MTLELTENERTLILQLLEQASMQRQVWVQVAEPLAVKLEGLETPPQEGVEEE